MEHLTHGSQYILFTLALISQIFKESILDLTILLKTSKSTTFPLPQQLNFYKAQMAPQTGSAARKQAATTSSQESDLRKDIMREVPKDIPELETTPTIPEPRLNPFCLSKEQVDRICGYFAYLPIPPKPRARAIQKHSEKLPAHLPAELDYLVTLLAPLSIPSGPRAHMMNSQPIDWSTVTAKFNDKFSHCQPRTEQALKCAMRASWYDIVIAIFRERCRRANAGEDNAGVYGDKTSSELYLLFTNLCSGGFLRTRTSYGTR